MNLRPSGYEPDELPTAPSVNSGLKLYGGKNCAIFSKYGRLTNGNKLSELKASTGEVANSWAVLLPPPVPVFYTGSNTIIFKAAALGLCHKLRTWRSLTLFCLAERKLKMNRPLVISIANEKGGVGKTTTALNLGYALEKLGYNVCLVDLDKQCSLSTSCGYVPNGEAVICDLIFEMCMRGKTEPVKAIRHSESGIDYIASSSKLDTVTSQISSDSDSNYVLRKIFSSDDFKSYDYIVIDNKTATDILTQNALNASDYVIIPIEAGIYSFDGLDSMTKKISSIQATTNPKLKLLGILFNKSETRTETGRAVSDAVSELYDDKLFCTVVPNRKAQTEKAIALQQGCVNIKRNTLGDIYLALANEVAYRTGRKGV